MLLDQPDPPVLQVRLVLRARLAKMVMMGGRVRLDRLGVLVLLDRPGPQDHKVP